MEDERILLLRECSHRIDNELAVAVGALRLKRDGRGADLEHAIGRLEGAAEVHALLARCASAGELDLSKVLDGLGRALSRVASGSGCVIVVVAMIILVSGRDAHLVTRIVNELVLNSLRHAYRVVPGAVLVTLEDDGQTTLLSVSDAGEGDGWSRPGGHGRELIDQLALRLGGLVSRRGVVGSGRLVEIVTPTLRVQRGSPCGN